MQAARKENESAPADATAQGGADAKREQSSVEFPYADLNAAITVAQTVAEIGGRGCDLEHLAGVWQVSQLGGGFRARYAPARIFGLATVERGRINLTPLGMRIVDRTQEAAARAEAFLQIGLYRSIYEKYKGYQLPGNVALEGEMVALGVAPKQKDKARQAFMRSANQAGFFWAGPDRLVRPNINAPAPSAPETLEQETADAPAAAPEPRRGGGGSGGGSYHPFIQGLLQTLPEPGTVWAIEGRAAWLKAAAQNFTLMYQGEGTIDVTATPPVKHGLAA